MDVKELREFRRKLVKARTISARSDYLWLRHSLREGGFSNVETDKIAKQIAYWYFEPVKNEERPASQRKAMWDNSIAAIDAQLSTIAKGE